MTDKGCKLEGVPAPAGLPSGGRWMPYRHEKTEADERASVSVLKAAYSCRRQPASYRLLRFSALRDSAYRTLTSAGTAVYAGSSIDLVFAFAHADSAYGALAFARAASNTGITDYVCHSIYPPFILGYSHFSAKRRNVQVPNPVQIRIIRRVRACSAPCGDRARPRGRFF